MSHEITVNAQGQAEAFYTKEPAWHKLGTVVNEAPDSLAALQLARLDWTVEKKEIQVVENLIGCGGYRALQRADDNRVLSVVTDDYSVLQNRDCFTFMDALASEGVKYESAGSLKGGKLVWMLAQMPGEFEVSKDDVMKQFILVVNGHGGVSFKVFPTNVRVVCWNTYQQALSEAGKIFNARHVGRIELKVDEARALLFGVTKQQADLNKLLKKLSIKGVVKSQVDEFIASMFPLPAVKNDDVEKKVSKRILDNRAAVLKSFDEDPQQQTEAARGTAFGLFNSYTQWLEHDRRVLGKTEADKSVSRLNHSWFGGGVADKERALVEVMRIAGVNEN